MSASRCTSVELSLSVVAYFFSNKTEKMISSRSPDSLHKNAIYVSHFLTCVLLFLIATFRLKKNLNQVIHFYYSASIFHSRKSKKFLLSRTIARDIDSLMDYKCRH